MGSACQPPGEVRKLVPRKSAAKPSGENQRTTKRQPPEARSRDALDDRSGCEQLGRRGGVVGIWFGERSIRFAERIGLFEFLDLAKRHASTVWAVCGPMGGVGSI